MKYSLWGLLGGLGIAGTIFLPSLAPDKRAQNVDSAQRANTFSQSVGLQSESWEGRNALSLIEAKMASRAKLMPDDVQSVLAIRAPLRHGEFVWNDKDVPQGPIHIWVDLRRQTISVFRAGHEIGAAVIVYGANEKQTPQGRFEILSKHRHYRSRQYGAEMPHAMFITQDGIALHSSILRPRHATHGCVGLPDEFSRQLFNVAEVGSVVEIWRSDKKSI